jgi:DNA primase
MIPAETIERVKEATDIAEIASEHVELRQRGRNFVGLCPFHNEKTPSFNVSPEKQMYYCFGCGVGGDVFKFTQEIDKSTFVDAVTGLAERAGIRLPKPNTVAVTRRRTTTPRKQRREQPLRPPDDIWQARAEELAQIAETTLWSPVGAPALTYLRGRGFMEEMIRAARLGYIPTDIHEAPRLWGLPADHNDVWLPRGISIPWRACGSLWRLNIRRPEGEPKYCGPAGYAQGLYGADGLPRGLPVVLCEGEFDALAVAQEAGDKVTAVATGSTGGGRRQRWLRLLSSAPTVLVAFDGDTPGDEAAEWWINEVPKATRLTPDVDAAAMLEAGKDVRGWIVEAGR